VDMFAQTFSVAGEKQENLADEETLVLLKRFSRNPEIKKARAEFERAQEVEERFHKDFEGQDFTGGARPLSPRLSSPYFAVSIPTVGTPVGDSRVQRCPLPVLHTACEVF